jgi:hypothetical protein
LRLIEKAQGLGPKSETISDEAFQRFSEDVLVVLYWTSGFR